jgi:CubicO group peptidase (beta-lactamase class C family)
MAGCWLDQPYKHRGPMTPEDLGDGWPVASPAEVGIDPAALAAIHDEILREDRHFGVLGLLVIKDGKLVFETYTRTPDDRDRTHALQSATKSVTSLVFGATRDRGDIPLDATLCSIVGDACRGLEPAKLAITLEHLLTMRSGIAFDNEDFSIDMMVGRPDDPLRYILAKPMYAAPGERFYYRDADPQLISYALQHLRGRTLASLGTEYLFEPLGITDHFWDEMPDGASTAAFALHLRPRDLAKLGQLLLDGGRWHGEQVVSSAWCQLATTPMVPAVEGQPDNPRSYGYYFWIPTVPESYFAWGHGGQFVVVVPAKQLVLVQVAMPDTSSDDLHGGEPEDFFALTRALWQ